MTNKGVSQNSLNGVDSEISELITKDLERQNTHIHLIASENFASKAVMEASGSILTNKYSEGFPGRRYYEGCEVVDKIEQLAIDRACELFEADHANVQPHSGSSANMAVYLALLEPGDTVLGMSLDQGGHLTHGSPVNFSGKVYNFVGYGLNETTEIIDMEKVRDIAIQTKPKLIIAGYSSYSQNLDYEKFRNIADEVGAYFMVDAAHFIGLVAGKVVNNPMHYADIVTATTHKALRGPRGGIILCKEDFAKDIDRNIFPGAQGGPLNNQIAAKAVCFKEALSPDFREYTKQIVNNATTLSNSFQEQGLRVVSGGTQNHLVLVDTRSVDDELTGKEAGILLNERGITLNRNSIPFDPRSPFVTSGIRMGTPAVTTCGMKEEELTKVGYLISEIMKNRSDIKKLDGLEKEVRDLATSFQPYA
ncbi:serine hydroxymethyltransferase [Acidimicrobiaceae bacterium]|nr:serine hydroxymethyltransferase [Acidimicrobiaceae bacterium]|tara:strand:+ start:1544 stop:2806 length:1263 start_codon:yes stop_codon:yes gene_type:complete